MTNSTNTFAETTIVAFHIGRGGHFWNAGHLSFIGQEKIGKYTDNLFISYENAFEISKKINGRENLQATFEKAMYGDINAVAFLSKIGLHMGEKVYVDCSGSHVGLTVAEEATGIGRINIDGDYDTTYTCRLSDCSEKELQLIASYDGYIDSNIRDYAKEQLGISDEIEENEQ